MSVLAERRRKRHVSCTLYSQATRAKERDAKLPMILSLATLVSLSSVSKRDSLAAFGRNRTAIARDISAEARLRMVSAVEQS